jgi:hypothetical protein
MNTTSNSPASRQLTSAEPTVPEFDAAASASNFDDMPDPYAEAAKRRRGSEAAEGSRQGEGGAQGGEVAADA